MLENVAYVCMPAKKAAFSKVLAIAYGGDRLRNLLFKSLSGNSNAVSQWWSQLIELLAYKSGHKESFQFDCI